MQLDKLYIDEAKRIRKTYLNNLADLLKKEAEVKKYSKMMDDIKKQIDDGESANSDFFVNKLLEMGSNIDKIQNVITPYYDKIQKLDKAREILYNNIKDKYPDITDEEIQEQIIPHIKPIDEDFRKKNQKLRDIIEKI